MRAERNGGGLLCLLELERWEAEALEAALRLAKEMWASRLLREDWRRAERGDVAALVRRRLLTTRRDSAARMLAALREADEKAGQEDWGWPFHIVTEEEEAESLKEEERL